MPKKESGMWRNKNAPMSKNYRKGGKSYRGGGWTDIGVQSGPGGGRRPTPTNKKDWFNNPNTRPPGIAPIQEGLGQVRPGMSTGGGTEVGKKVQSYKEYVKKTFGGGKT